MKDSKELFNRLVTSCVALIDFYFNRILFSWRLTYNEIALLKVPTLSTTIMDKKLKLI